MNYSAGFDDKNRSLSSSVNLSSSSAKNRFANIHSKTIEKKERLLPIQRKEKLKTLLIQKFVKKYGFKDSENLIEEQVNTFLFHSKPLHAQLLYYHILCLY